MYLPVSLSGVEHTSDAKTASYCYTFRDFLPETLSLSSQ